jgi:hypothetical protein
MTVRGPASPGDLWDGLAGLQIVERLGQPPVDGFQQVPYPDAHLPPHHRRNDDLILALDRTQADR